MSGLGRILILGGAGQVGRELKRSFAGAGELRCPGRDEADLARPDELRELIRLMRPDVILNAAAYTAVDRAEREAEVAFAINGHAPGVLAEEAARANAVLVHYSTDYVFDGAKQGPWSEDDEPRPLNIYGASKLAGEEAIGAAGCRALILRTSWVYGAHGQNFLLTMLRLGRERAQLRVVDDQIGAPTTARELARATRTIVEGALGGRFGPAEEWTGLYHMTCGGATSWCGFAREIFARGGDLVGERRPEVIPITTADYKTAAKRPANSVLSNERLQSRLGVALKEWDAALDEALCEVRALDRRG